MSDENHNRVIRGNCTQNESAGFRKNRFPEAGPEDENSGAKF
jgi:hypothetical protein